MYEYNKIPLGVAQKEVNDFLNQLSWTSNDAFVDVLTTPLASWNDEFNAVAPATA